MTRNDGLVRSRDGDLVDPAQLEGHRCRKGWIGADDSPAPCPICRPESVQRLRELAERRQARTDREKGPSPRVPPQSCPTPGADPTPSLATHSPAHPRSGPGETSGEDPRPPPGSAPAATAAAGEWPSLLSAAASTAAAQPTHGPHHDLQAGEPARNAQHPRTTNEGTTPMIHVTITPADRDLMVTELAAAAATIRERVETETVSIQGDEYQDRRTRSMHLLQQLHVAIRLDALSKHLSELQPTTQADDAEEPAERPAATKKPKARTS